MANMIGKTLGKYQLAERLGKGGMAEVYKAHHPKLDRDVTIKILYSHLAEGEDFTARFEREAKAVAALRHPHIVQIHDFDVENDTYYMVMEYIDGGTLQARMNQLSKDSAYMPVRQVLSILEQVAQALDYAHRHGIIHRDIKPSNIMLDSSGTAFLTDFGIARMVSVTQFTATGALIGTPTYMSPEQAQGLELTEASDIYSLGVILFELLTGKAPFAADTPLAVIHKHINERLPSPRSLRPDLTAALEQVVFKALTKEPADRYQRAVDLMHDLANALTEESIARLDGQETLSPPPKSALPTMHIEEGTALRAQLPTEIMEEGINAQRVEPTVEEAIAEPEVKEVPAAKGKTALISKPSERAIERGIPATLPSETSIGAGIPVQRTKPRAALWAVIGVVLVGLLALILSLLSGAGGSCTTIEACLAQAGELSRQGDLEGAVASFDAAISLVPGDQHPNFAGVWCDRADIERDLGRRDDAIHSYTQCSEWTQSDPTLQPLRDRAEFGLEELR